MVYRDVKENEEIEIEFNPFTSLRKVVLELQELKNDNNINYFINYYGVKLSSRDIDIDKAYQKCFGFDFKYAIENPLEFFEKEEILKRTTIKELGKKYIISSKYPLWNEMFENSNFDFLEIEVALEIIKTLKEEPDILISEEKFKNRGLSGYQAFGVLMIILTLSERGIEFYKFMTRHIKLTKAKKLRIKKQEKLNKMLDQGKSLDEVLEELKDYRAIRIRINQGENVKWDEYFLNVLVKSDNTFEGFDINDNYITGILTDDVISFICFDGDKQEHFCGNLTGETVIAKKELIGNNEYLNNSNVLINLEKINIDFEHEIVLDEEFSKIRHSFTNKEKEVYDFYINNRGLVIESSKLSLKEDLETSSFDKYYKKIIKSRKERI